MSQPLDNEEPARRDAGDDEAECVRWAYRLLLGREPESEAAVQQNPFKNDRAQLIRSMLCSEEFRSKHPSIPLAPQDEHQEEIEREIQEALDGGFDEVALLHDYRRLGRTQRAQVLETLCRIGTRRLTRPWQQDFRDATSPGDIAAAFRLLLGRNPGGELEWRGHLNELDGSLDEVVRAYLGSLEFSRRDLLQQIVPQSIEVASIEGFEMYAARDDKAVGAHVLFGAYEPEVTKVFRDCLRPGMNVIDVGANIGYFTFLSASVVGADGLVTAVEANPDNARLIEGSRRLNRFGNVRLANVAVGRELGLLSLNTDFTNGVTAIMERERDLWNSRIVPCVPLIHLLPPERPVDLIKIDIEGAEHEALLSIEGILKRDRPIVISEFAPEAIASISRVSGESYLGFLVNCGLELAIIRKDGGPRRFATDIAGVMAAWRDSGRDHIDILATPGD